MDFKIIQELITQMNQSDLTSLEIETPEVTIKMQKDSQIKNLQPQIELESVKIADIPLTLKETEIKEVNLPNQVEQKIEIENDKNCKIVTSPIVGTFYASASPQKPPLVKAGDKVKKGQTLCIIEAMKLMNEIESDYDGEIVEILVSNEQPVEYNQPLFKIY